MRVLADLGMRTAEPVPARGGTTVVRHTTWVRARRTGILRTSVAGPAGGRGRRAGDHRRRHRRARATMKAPIGGVVIGHTQHPLVHRGDALFHLADLDPRPRARRPACPEPALITQAIAARVGAPDAPEGVLDRGAALRADGGEP